MSLMAAFNQTAISNEPTEAGLVRLFAAAGLKVEAQGWGYGHVNWKKTKIEVIAQNTAQGLAKISANLSWRVDPYVSEAGLSKWVGSGSSATKWTSYLDHTVTVHREIDISGCSPAAALKAGFQQLNQDATKFERQLKGAKFQADEQSDLKTPPPVNEKLLVDDIQLRDLTYLTKQWGWEYKGAFGGSTPGWAFPIQIGDDMVWLSELISHNGIPRKGFGMRCILTTPSESFTTELINRLKNGTKGIALVGDAGGRMGVNSDFEITSPVSVGTVREAIEEFSRQVQAVKQQIVLQGKVKQ